MRSFKLNTMYDIKITKTTFQHTFKSDQFKKLQSQLLWNDSTTTCNIKTCKFRNCPHVYSYSMPLQNSFNWLSQNSCFRLCWFHNWICICICSYHRPCFIYLKCKISRAMLLLGLSLIYDAYFNAVDISPYYFRWHFPDPRKSFVQHFYVLSLTIWLLDYINSNQQSIFICLDHVNFRKDHSNLIISSRIRYQVFHWVADSDTKGVIFK